VIEHGSHDNSGAGTAPDVAYQDAGKVARVVPLFEESWPS
jgi:hypothetical protein